MKHTLFILGALFAGTFLFAEELDVNGNFMKTSPQDAKQAAGWTKSWSNMKDIGNVTLEKDRQTAGMRFASGQPNF